MTGERKEPVILFDGYCNMCASLVAYLAEGDMDSFSFVALQSEEADKILEEFPGFSPETDSVVLVDGGEIYEESDAVTQVLKIVGGLYSLAALLLSLVPEFLRDSVYRLVASNRYRLFGRRKKCLNPADLRQESSG